MTIPAKLLNLKQFVCMLLKPTTFRVSPPTVIMIAITFTMSILCVTLEPTTFYMSFPEVIMIANVCTSLKHQIPRNREKRKKKGGA